MIESVIFWFAILYAVCNTVIIFSPDKLLTSKSSPAYKRLASGIHIVFIGLVLYYIWGLTNNV